MQVRSFRIRLYVGANFTEKYEGKKEMTSVSSWLTMISWYNSLDLTSNTYLAVASFVKIRPIRYWDLTKQSRTYSQRQRETYREMSKIHSKNCTTYALEWWRDWSQIQSIQNQSNVIMNKILKTSVSRSS